MSHTSTVISPYTKYIIQAKRIVAKADTGASRHYWVQRYSSALQHPLPLTKSPEVKLPDSTVIKAAIT
eukprot:10816387-Ditylum_brightwellii.AAC.1